MQIVQPGDIVQVLSTNGIADVTGSLLVVEEVRSWGIQAFMHVPYKGSAYFRIENGNFIKVGTVYGEDSGSELDDLVLRGER